MLLQFSDIYMNVAAQTLHIVTNVYDVMRQEQARGGGASGADDGDAPSTSKQYYDLWQTKVVSRDEWLKPDPGQGRWRISLYFYSI